MDELTAVTGAVDRLVSGALAPLIELLANDVEFEVASGGDAPRCRKHSGRQAVADYFDALGDLPAFWRMDEFSTIGGRVIAWGDERPGHAIVDHLRDASRAGRHDGA